MNNLKKYYINELGESFRKNFEDKTGKLIGTGKYFDMTEIINYYGGIIEYDDLYEEKYKLDSYICKIKEDKYDFKIIIDKEKSEKLKTLDEKGNKTYGIWNLFIMKLFYYVIINNDIMHNMKDGEIIFPNANYVTIALKHKKSQKEKIYQKINLKKTLKKDNNNVRK